MTINSDKIKTCKNKRPIPPQLRWKQENNIQLPLMGFIILIMFVILNI